MKIPDDVRNVSKATALAIAGLAALVIFGLLAASMFVFGFGFFAQKTANFRGETQKRNQVEGSGAFRTAAYNHFFDLCAGVQSNEASIRNLQLELAGPPKPPADRVMVISASITALRNARATGINQYNADAVKSYTVGQFRSRSLPYQLSLTAKETSCTTASSTP